MVEAVILLPVLAVILFGVLFVQARGTTTQRARATARRCAWQHAVGGCGAIPEGCGAATHEAAEATPGAGGESAPDADAPIEAVSAEAHTVLDFPILGDAIDGLFGAATRFTVSQDVERGGFSGKAAGRVYLVCNATPATPWTIVKDVFCDRTKLCSP
jgi:hypothetical protein